MRSAAEETICVLPSVCALSRSLRLAQANCYGEERRNLLGRLPFVPFATASPDFVLGPRKQRVWNGGRNERAQNLPSG